MAQGTSSNYLIFKIKFCIASSHLLTYFFFVRLFVYLFSGEADAENEGRGQPSQGNGTEAHARNRSVAKGIP